MGVGGTTVSEDIKAELKAIETLLETLEPLAQHVRESVIDYVFKRLNIAGPRLPAVVTPAPTLAEAPSLVRSPAKPTDILSLKEDKQPKTAAEMVAVMAFYLAHCAPEGEARDYITADDIKKYFVQAHFELPASHSQTLVNTKNAGYLDPIEKGQYRLNSVGHNLVAHKMPRDGATRRSTGSSRKKPSKKPVRKVKK
jgi:hypothetical protein